MRLLIDLAFALARRVATPPPGGAALRWAAAWVTYLTLFVMLVGVARMHPAPAVGTWLFVLAVEASYPIEPEHRTIHVVWMLVLLLIPALLIATMYPDVARRAWNAALVLVAASALDRRPLARGVFWAGALATWAAWLLVTVIAWLLLTNAGLRALQPMGATLDPHVHTLAAVAIQASAGVVTASMMWCTLWLHRWQMGRWR